MLVGFISACDGSITSVMERICIYLSTYYLRNPILFRLAGCSPGGTLGPLRRLTPTLDGQVLCFHRASLPSKLADTPLDLLH